MDKVGRRRLKPPPPPLFLFRAGESFQIYLVSLSVHLPKLREEEGTEHFVTHDPNFFWGAGALPNIRCWISI